VHDCRKDTYDLDGQVLRTFELTDDLTYRQWDYAYDHLRRTYMTQAPAAGGGRETTYSFYDPAGNPRYSVTERSPTDYLVEMRYDTLNRPTETIEPAAAGQHAAPVTRTVYNVAGEVAEIIEGVGTALQRATTFVTDKLGRTIQTILPSVAAGAPILESARVPKIANASKSQVAAAQQFKKTRSEFRLPA